MPALALSVLLLAGFGLPAQPSRDHHAQTEARWTAHVYGGLRRIRSLRIRISVQSTPCSRWSNDYGQIVSKVNSAFI